MRLVALLGRPRSHSGEEGIGNCPSRRQKEYLGRISELPVFAASISQSVIAFLVLKMVQIEEGYLNDARFESKICICFINCRVIVIRPVFRRSGLASTRRPWSWCPTFLSQTSSCCPNRFASKVQRKGSEGKHMIPLRLVSLSSVH